jgi:hypothetical protein
VRFGEDQDLETSAHLTPDSDVIHVTLMQGRECDLTFRELGELHYRIGKVLIAWVADAVATLG